MSTHTGADPAVSVSPPDAQRSQDRLLTAAEIAEMLAVPVSWVRESTRSGAMPCYPLGRYRRYRRDEVLAWLAECRQPGRPIQLRRTA